MVLQVLLLMVENVEKSRLIFESCRYSPEELASPLARLLFSWLIPLLRLGYDTILSMATLTPLSEDLKSQQLEPKLVRFLTDVKSSTLLRELFRLRRGLLLPIIPRMLLLGFTLARPFLIYTAVSQHRFYLRTSRQLRLLDIEAKAPLYTNFKETILGMNTIRAYGGEFGSFLKEKHAKVLDDSQQPVYLLYTVQRWLSLVLDLVVACLATLLIVVAVQTRSGTSGSDMGVALVNLTSFNQYLTMLIRCWASMETSLGAIARIKDFSHETPVADGCGHELSQTMTAIGALYLKYKKPETSLESAGDSSEDTSNLNLNHQALDSINLTIQSGTKLAITGRSGSGKSTLVSSLFRILPLSSGKISIGGMDIAQVDQQVIQDLLNAITQSNFFLSRISLRENLDPSGSSGEEGEGSATVMVEVMREVLDSLGIWSQVEERGGLEGLFSRSSWSVGQLQLLSVARAIVKKRRAQSHPGSGWKILVLDEVTSSLDETSARVVRDRIKVEFEDYTILSIVHKFDGVIEDMDEMIIMDQGRVARRGLPRQLLQAM
ncbi:ABC transporter integral membrane type 1 [Fusarium coicis]|nr:ABC transporter integral membrane type 1 [Fusarium coicis]